MMDKLKKYSFVGIFCIAKCFNFGQLNIQQLITYQMENDLPKYYLNLASVDTGVRLLQKLTIQLCLLPTTSSIQTLSYSRTFLRNYLNLP